MSPVEKQREEHTGFQDVRPLAEQEMMRTSIKKHPPNLIKTKDPQVLINTAMALDPSHFEKEGLLESIEPLDADATFEEQMAKLEEIYNALKVGGDLKIEYEFSKGKTPQTPNDVMGSLACDCDEFSRLFYAAAEHLGVDTSMIKMVKVSFEAEHKLGVTTTKPESEVHYFIFIDGEKKKIFDLSYGKTEEIQELNLETLTSFYKGVPAADSDYIVSAVSEITYVAEDVEEIAGTYYDELSEYYQDQGNHGQIFDALISAHELNPFNPDIPFRFLELGEDFFDNGDYEEAGLYANHAIDISLTAKPLKLTKKVKTTLYNSYILLGRVYLTHEKDPETAKKKFETATKIYRNEYHAYANLGTAFHELVSKETDPTKHAQYKTKGQAAFNKAIQILQEQVKNTKELKKQIQLNQQISNIQQQLQNLNSLSI